MQAAASIPSPESAILSRLVGADNEDLPPEAARAILDLGFGADDRARMHELAEKGRVGALSPAEDAELESYCRVGRFLDLIHSKARTSLRKAGQIHISEHSKR